MSLKCINFTAAFLDIFLIDTYVDYTKILFLSEADEFLF